MPSAGNPPDSFPASDEAPPEAGGLDDLDTEIARRYAHFHRVLAGLLTGLSERERAFWATSDRHVVSPTGADNRYAKAVYLVRDLSPYEAQLAELEEVRAEAMELIGSTSPTHALLVPKVCRGVAEARILENTGFASRPRKRADVLARLARKREEAHAAREAFANFPTRVEKRREIDQEVAEIEAGISALEATAADTLREHYRYTRIMCHVHYEDPSAFDQLYVGDVGVILQGNRADAFRHDPERRRHRRTIGALPVAVVGPYVFYEEEAWRAARDRS